MATIPNIHAKLINGNWQGTIRVPPGSNSPFYKWGNRIGSMVDIASSGCTPSLQVWARAAFEASPTLLLTPLKPSPTDFLIVRGRQGHGTRRKFSFDVWENADLPAIENQIERWVLWDVGQAAIKGLWWIAIGDAITKFDLRWMSTAYQYAGCTVPGQGWAQMTGAPDGGPSDIGSGLFIPPFPQQQSEIFKTSGSNIEVPAGYDPSVGLSVNWGKDILGRLPVGVTCWITELGSGRVVGTSAGQMHKDLNGGSAEFFVKKPGLGTGGGVYQAFCHAEQTGGTFTNCSMSAYGGAVDKNLLPDP